MTDRHTGYVVTLDEDIRDDDAEGIVTAIKMIKHVISVKPVIGSVELSMAKARMKSELGLELMELLNEY